MEILKAHIPIIYFTLKTLWEVLCTVSLSILIFAVILFVVWLINRARA